MYMMRSAGVSGKGPGSPIVRPMVSRGMLWSAELAGSQLMAWFLVEVVACRLWLGCSGGCRCRLVS
jgi:hypothetical protein